MKDRIQQLMQHERMNQQEFSLASGIAPASLSSIFTGRTQPTLKHAQALHEHFPNLNTDWLLYGDGEMFLSSGEANPEAATSAIATGQTSLDFGLFTQSKNDVQSSSPSVSAVDQAPSHAAVSGYGSGQDTPVDSQNSMGYIPQIPIEYLKKLDTKPRRIAEIRIFFDDGTFEVFKGN